MVSSPGSMIISLMGAPTIAYAPGSSESLFEIVNNTLLSLFVARTLKNINVL